MGESTAPLLGRLARAWQEANPRQAAGGSYAMAGFHFQLDLALLKILESWKLSGPAGFKASVETLSDIAVENADEPTVVIQAKLTQTPAALRKGLDDLLSIHEAALREAPDRAEEVRYGLTFRSGDPAAAQTTVEEWVAVEPAARRPLVEQLTIGRHQDPGGEVVSLLANRYLADRPRDLRRQWAGGLLEAVGRGTPEAREEALKLRLEDIEDRLSSLERRAQRHGGVYVVAPTDVPPSESPPGEILEGQPPTFGQLRGGYFADRPEVLAQLRNRFLRWTEERSSSVSPGSVPVFWIAGRSGAGKSVLLIQFLSQLRREGWDPVFWLTRGKGLLPEAARWAREGWEGAVTPLIGIDDPYGPIGRCEEAWDGFLDELNVPLQDDPGGIPIVVCCGPTEQARRLKDDFSGRLEVEAVELPPEMEGELEELRAWYRSRTGCEAPNVDKPNTLLVQVFFEWGRGQTLQHFADSFKGRVRDVGGDRVFELMAEVLALNRLYLGFPPEALERRLSAEERDRLEQLRRDEHLAVNGEEDRPGLWLAHPHLSNGIYETWFPIESASHQRREHFEKAAREWMAAGEAAVERLAPIRAIALGLAAQHGAIHGRVEPNVVEALPGLYARAQGERASSPVEELALWIEIRAATGIELNPDPVAAALPLLTPEATRLPATSLLIEAILADVGRLNLEQRDHMFKLVGDLLEEAPSWGDWARVASASMAVDGKGRLDDVVSGWVKEHLSAEGAGWVLATAVNEGGELGEALTGEAWRFLRNNPRHRSWGRVWTALWDQAPDNELQELGISHLEAFSRDRSWSHIWSRLANEPLDEESAKAVAGLGADWLLGHMEHRGWGIVWGWLWEANPSEKLERQARELLKQIDTTLPTFSFVWMGLWSKGRRDKDLVEAGTRSLRRLNTNHMAWGQIFPALYETFPNPDLRALGMRWLQTASPSDPGWGHVLPALWQMALENGDGDLLDELEPHARRFLREAPPDHSGWNYVFILPWKRNRTDSLRKRGFGWLDEADPDHPGIGRVWEALWDDAGGRRDLVEWADGWFSGRGDHPSWPFIWRRICLETEADEDHLHRGEEWVLQTATGDPGWTYVFRALWPLRQSAAVRSRASSWLDEAGDAHLAWDLIWRDLWGTAAADEDHEALGERGEQWLAGSLEHAHWAEIWLRLWAHGESDELRALAGRWLAGPGADHPRTALVRTWLEDPEEEEAPEPNSWGGRVDLLRLRLVGGRGDLLSEAMKITSKPPPVDVPGDQVAWKNLWLEVWSRVESPELRSAAITWLQAPSPTRSGRSYVWEALWSAGRSRELYDLGVSYLSTAPLDRSLWPAIWIKLWDFEQSKPLATLARGWLEVNPTHKDAPAVDRRLQMAVKEKNDGKDDESELP